MKGLLAATMLAGLAMAQVNQATIHIPDDVAAAGITLLPATDPALSPTLREISGNGPEATMLRSLLPYAVLLVNKSGKKLLATGVGFEWTSADGKRSGQYFVITAFNPDGAGQLAPGKSRLFVPQRGLNQYFAIPATERGPLATFKSFTARTGISQSTIGGDYNALVNSITTELAKASALKVVIDGAVFEDYSYVGSERLMNTLRADQPEIHR